MKKKREVFNEFCRKWSLNLCPRTKADSAIRHLLNRNTELEKIIELYKTSNDFYGDMINWSFDGDFKCAILENGQPIRQNIDLDDVLDNHGGKLAREIERKIKNL